MTTLTTTQLDELEAKAKLVRDAGWRDVSADYDHVLRLVAITRAALAWSETSQVRDPAGYGNACQSLAAALRG